MNVGDRVRIKELRSYEMNKGLSVGDVGVITEGFASGNGFNVRFDGKKISKESGNLNADGTYAMLRSQLTLLGDKENPEDLRTTEAINDVIEGICCWIDDRLEDDLTNEQVNAVTGLTVALAELITARKKGGTL